MDFSSRLPWWLYWRENSVVWFIGENSAWKPELPLIDIIIVTETGNECTMGSTVDSDDLLALLCFR